jgi:hypothetical protein
VVITWFLRGILVFLGGINLPRTDVSDFPTGFSLSKVFFTSSSIFLLYGYI